MYRFAMLRVGDSHLAEELVQETFVKAIKGYGSFRGAASIRTWLMQILRNEIAQHFRRNMTRKRKMPENADHDARFKMDELLHPELENQLFKSKIEKDEFWETFHMCLHQLPEHFAEVFLMRLSDPDASVDFLCKEAGLKPSNFSVRLFRTRLLLRACLEKHWLEDRETK